MEDGIEVAEISLYSTLLKLLELPVPLHANGICGEIDAWHQKWGHVLGISTLPPNFQHTNNC
jgi:hypothetical protein